ncbi:MAG: ammonia-forming cytochrome c nitrite reductase subunit c552 [Dermatophilus congolensis]|nr:ammonia-forming cytochrome c nitrite reductase subunit c552 [Dermatophilus congolensis]
MSTSTQQEQSGRQRGGRRWLLVAAIGLVALVTMGMTALLVNILERQSEGEQYAYTKVQLDEKSYDPAVWGQNFPLQYEGWKATSEMTPTEHGGSKPVEIKTADGKTHTGTASRIEHDPRLTTMWLGYAFAVDYREARGHAYMLEDQRLTRRVTEFAQPGTCLNCHASTVPIMDELGNGDRNAGFVAMNKMTYSEATAYAEHPVGCIDCHDPKTMALRVTRPAFVTGMKELKASQGVKDYDVNADATPAEMRTFVCGQCHVEYYFDGPDKTLRFPWAKGIKIDQIMADSADHIDFTHTTTGTKILKAQHPEFDLSYNGIHGQAGVSCADCHMPYKREGSAKISDHQIQSPMLAVNNSCQTCHNVPEAELKTRVANIQNTFIQTRDESMDALMALIADLEKAQTDGTPADRIVLARQYHRVANFYNDYLYSENGYGFHAPAYSQQIFAQAIDAARKGQLALKGAVTTPPTQPGPDQAGPAPSPMPKGQTSTPTIPPLGQAGTLAPKAPAPASAPAATATPGTTPTPTATATAAATTP